VQTASYRPRRQPAHIYRRRRAVAATAVLLLVAGVVQLAGGGGGGGGSDGEQVDAAAPDTTTTTSPAAPPCVEGDAPVRQDPLQEWATVIVDTDRALPADFAPNDLVNVADAGFPLGAAVRAIVMDDLRELREAAEANGTPIGVIAGYRSHQQQADLFNRRTEQLGDAETRSRVARPGHSEHQLGTTVDVGDEGATDVDQTWGATPAGQWIAANAHKYGWVLSYPVGAADRTCYDYEPWHLRYIGRERAAQLLDSGRTLREFLYALERDGTPPTTAPPSAGTADE
jgi:zinc D-Ala-D-Ala carboxypeptidase